MGQPRHTPPKPLALVQSPGKRLVPRLGQVLQHRALASADVHRGGHAGFEGHVSQFRAGLGPGLLRVQPRLGPVVGADLAVGPLLGPRVRAQVGELARQA